MARNVDANTLANDRGEMFVYVSSGGWLLKNGLDDGMVDWKPVVNL